MLSYRGYQFIYNRRFIDKRYKKLIPRPGDGNIGQLIDLLCRPPVNFETVQPNQENAGIIKTFDAVDGGNGHPVGGELFHTVRDHCGHSQNPFKIREVNQSPNESTVSILGTKKSYFLKVPSL